MNDMDAYKELVERMPDMELMNIGELQGVVFWAGAGAKWARLQIETARNIPGMQAQVDAWIREGQMAGELEIKGQQRLGKIARETERSQPEQIRSSDGSRAAGTISTGQLPKWQRLGFKSEAAMAQAEFLEAHPKEVNEVIKEAKQEDDLPSKGAVKAKVRMKAAEERAAAAEQRAAEKTEKADKKEVREHPKFVAAYLEATKEYRDALVRAIKCAEEIALAPETRQFILNRHERLVELMRELEEL